jgi:hypothetical protein
MTVIRKPTDISTDNNRLSEGRGMTDTPDDWGCEYCRNDGALNDDGRCPQCDAQFEDDDDD